MTTRTLEPPGTRFGSWTVLEYVGTNQHKMTMALVRCDCSATATVIVANLRTGRTTQCRTCSNLRMKGRAPKKVLTPALVAKIKNRIASGDGLSQIASDHRVHHSTVYKIKIGQTWRSVPWPK